MDLVWRVWVPNDELLKNKLHYCCTKHLRVLEMAGVSSTDGEICDMNNPTRAIVEASDLQLFSFITKRKAFLYPK